MAFELSSYDGKKPARGRLEVRGHSRTKGAKHEALRGEHLSYFRSLRLVLLEPESGCVGPHKHGE